jgi:hypothetical protein
MKICAKISQRYVTIIAHDVSYLETVNRENNVSYRLYKILQMVLIAQFG